MAQPTDKNAAGLSVLKTAIIKLGYPQTSTTTRFAGLFKHFEVIDERPDTSRIGIHAAWSTIGGDHSRQLIFARPAAGEIAAYLDARFAHPGAPYTALIILRTLWLSNANNLREELVKDPEKYDEKTKIRLKAEIYAEKGGLYTPVFRFDSLQSSERSGTHFGSDLSNMLADLADSATLLLAQKGEGGKMISRVDILQFNQSRFDPLIVRGGPLVKGAYASFEEFKENAPSLLDCEIKQEKDHLLLYVKETGGNTYYSHNAWGYCDGATIYVMKDGMLTPAWKEGRTWYLLSRAQIEDPQKKQGNYLRPGISSTTVSPVGVSAAMLGMGMGEASINRINKGTQMHIFTVDMDTGKIY
jgi:hypothetical protein